MFVYVCDLIPRQNPSTNILLILVTEVAWSMGVFSAAQTLLKDHKNLNIIGIIMAAAVCLSDPLTYQYMT